MHAGVGKTAGAVGRKAVYLEVLPGGLGLLVASASTDMGVSRPGAMTYRLAVQLHRCREGYRTLCISIF